MKVLITGATGFIGREIVSEFVSNNHEVFALGNTRRNIQSGLEKVEFLFADIADYEELSALEKLGGVGLVVHSAGLAHQFGETKWEDFERVNIKGTENALKLSLKLRTRHFILIGTTAIYGIVNGNADHDQKNFFIDEETPVNPQTLYAKSKLESEKIARRFCEANNIPLTVFRLAPVIGEANAGNVARLISAIDRNRFLWIGNGSNLKTLIYKRDVARACLELAEKKRPGTEIFNLSGEPVCMKDFVDEIAARLGKKTFPVSIPAGLLRQVFRINSKILKIGKIAKLSETVEKWLSDDVYSGEKIARTYGFKAQTSIIEAVARQVDFYKAEEKN